MSAAVRLLRFRLLVVVVVVVFVSASSSDSHHPYHYHSNQGDAAWNNNEPSYRREQERRQGGERDEPSSWEQQQKQQGDTDASSMTTNTNKQDAGRRPPAEQQQPADDWWSPPPPPSQQQQRQQQQIYNPIHYQFPSKDDTIAAAATADKSTQTRRNRRGRLGEEETYLDDEDFIPQTTLMDEPPPYHTMHGDPPEKYASPRTDAVTRYMMSSRPKRLLLRTSAGIVGAGMGGFVGKSLLNHPLSFGSISFLLCFVATFLRNPYGELSRALGLGLLFLLQRTHAIRLKYPTWRHVQASIGAAPRRPFPRSENPWKSNDLNFRMMYTLLAMAVVGSACGGNLPLLPTWMGALGGAGVFALGSTLKSARGDLMRSMGMRVVAMLEEVLDINAELHVVQKVGVVSGRVLDKLLILDRKHRIKDKMVSVVQWMMRQGNRAVSQVQADMQEEGEGGVPPPRRESGFVGNRDEFSRRDESRDENRPFKEEFSNENNF